VIIATAERRGPLGNWKFIGCGEYNAVLEDAARAARNQSIASRDRSVFCWSHDKQSLADFVFEQ
jgi:hypothetical protein